MAKYVDIEPITNKIDDSYSEEYNEWLIEINDLADMIDEASIADVKEIIRGSWIKFELEYDEECEEEVLSCKLPDDEQEVLVTDGKTVWEDMFLRDVGECYLDSGYEFVTRVTHWMPKPEPPIENKTK